MTNKKDRGFGVGIVILVIAVLAIGGAAYVTTRQDVNVNNETDDDSRSGVSAQRSAKDLLALGRDMRCTFSQTASGLNNSGVIYVSGGKMRGDFRTQTSVTGEVKSHMITDDQTMHMWSDIMPQGIKIEVSKRADTDVETGAPDFDQELDYLCEDWRPTPETFTLPSNVVFAEFGAGATVPPALPGGVNTPGGVNIPGGVSVPGGVSLPGGF